MPGHKGIGDVNRYDITEVDGADSLYSANGIIKESEENAGKLFGAHTFYSTEGSSHSIRAMLHLATLYARACGKRPLILAGRNAHKAFVSAIALLDIDVDWLMPEGSSYLSCDITKEYVEERLKGMESAPTAVYLTSPDYLGNLVDIEGIAEVCHKYGVLLLVDNAHGAYLKFLPQSRHPIDLGADACCDSAHKTLPVLTGGAYLHVSLSAPEIFSKNAKNSLSLFGSTSPSYLILASLDGANRYLAEGYAKKLSRLTEKIEAIKTSLCEYGHKLVSQEPLKLTLNAKAYGYSGFDLAARLIDKGFVPEFYDPDFVVLMLTPEIKDAELDRLKEALIAIPRRSAIDELPPKMQMPTRDMSPREAVLSDCETIPVSTANGRVLAAVTVGCPPAVPILISGERIDENAIKCFDYYGITECSVVK